MLKRFLPLILTLILLFAACAPQGELSYPTAPDGGLPESVITSQDVSLQTKTPDSVSEALPSYDSEPSEAVTGTDESAQSEIPPETEADYSLPIEGEYYYDVVNVVLYLELYGELPPNYITKDEARELGWEGGSVEDYLDGAAIGGDRFGNREGLLPEKSGRKYTECDIDTDGYYSRGSRRLVFSNDGLYFYSSDHYETFKEVTVTEDYEVIW